MADDPMKEGRARREVKERSFLLCLVVFSIVYCVFFLCLVCHDTLLFRRERKFTEKRLSSISWFFCKETRSSRID